MEEKWMKSGMRESEGKQWAAGGRGGARIMENSVPVTGVQNGSPHI